MADPFTAEIRAFGFNYAPYNWAFCDGQVMAIQQNSALFALLGTNYGGNGTTYSLLAAEIIRDALTGREHRFAHTFEFGRK